MIEQFLQTVLKFVKEIWFQLDSRFDLENTEAFKFLKPYLIQLQNNPVLMGVSVAALFFVPYILIKINSISRERERKLDELMEEMEEEEEEYDENDPRRLRRPDDSEVEAKAGSTDNEFILDPSPSDNEETTNIEENAEPVSSQLTESEFDKDLNELISLEENKDPNDINKETTNLEENAEPVNSQLTESEFDKDLNKLISMEDNKEPDNIKEETANLEENVEPVSSQLTESEFDKDLNELISLDENKEPNNIDDSSHDQAIKELQEGGELMELDDYLSGNDPLGNFLKLNDHDQDKIISKLQEEKERTISQLTEQVGEITGPHNPIKDLNQLHIGGDDTIDDDYTHEGEHTLNDITSLDADKEAPSSQEEPSTVSEFSDSEILSSLEPELEDMHDLEVAYEEEPIATPKTVDYEPELPGLTFEAEPAIPELEPEASAENFSFEAESMSFEETQRPKLVTPPSPLGETDSLIDRLKFLQTRFENRHQPLERSPKPAPSPAPVEKKIIATKDYVNFTEPRRYSSSPAIPPPDSKKYMDLLESFVFMKDQKKHK
jgi:hypothetical protein